MGRSRTPIGEVLESWVQVLILLGMGGMAGAVSFTHIHDWTVANGQASWVGWTNAIVTELIQIAGGLELRRRKRREQRARFVVCAMVTAVLVSLTAQVSQAPATLFGWIAAALPQAGFLVVVKIVLGRTTVTTAVVTDPVTVPVHHMMDRAETLAGPASAGRHALDAERLLTGDQAVVDHMVTDRAGPGGPLVTAGHAPGHDQVADHGLVRDQPARATVTSGLVTDQVRTSGDQTDVTGAVVRDQVTTTAVTTDQDRDQPDRTGVATLTTGLDRDQRSGTTGQVQDQDQVAVQDVTMDPLTDFEPDLVTTGRAVLDELVRRGDPVKRGTFAMGIRGKGRSIGTTKAGALLKALTEVAA